MASRGAAVVGGGRLDRGEGVLNGFRVLEFFGDFGGEAFGGAFEGGKARFIRFLGLWWLEGLWMVWVKDIIGGVPLRRLMEEFLKVLGVIFDD